MSMSSQQRQIVMFSDEARVVYQNVSIVGAFEVLVLLSVDHGTDVAELFFFSSRRRHTRSLCDWSSDVCSSDLTDCSAIRARPDQLQLEPVVIPFEIVAQKRRRFIQIHDQNINVTVIVKITESAASTGVDLGDSWARIQQFLKLSASHVSEDHPRRFT